MVVRRRLDLNGKAIAFLTTTVVDWKPILTQKPIPEIIRTQLFETAKFYNAHVVAYVIMPSHIHFLIDFDRIEKMPKFMWSFKTLTSRKIKETANQDFIREYMNKGKFHFWKPRYDDLIIVSEKQLRIKLDYIHNNPVKAKLVDVAGDWEYSSARNWLDGVSGPLPVRKDLL